MSATESLAIQRLKAERKHLKKDIPQGFFAKPLPKKTNKAVSQTELDYFTWICGIPGRKGSLWEGATLRVYMFFPPKYPAEPPKVQFDPPLFHPNIYPSGSVCLSILNQAIGWKPTITVKEILLGLQVLLDEPNLESPAQTDAYNCLRLHPADYNTKVREVVEANRSEVFESRLQTLVRSGEFRTTARPPPKENMSTVAVIDLDDIVPQVR